MTSKSANERSASKGSLDKGSAERRGPVLSIQKMAVFPTTLPETNSSHLKIDGWKTLFPLGIRPIFDGEMAVSFREGSHDMQPKGSPFGWGVKPC